MHALLTIARQPLPVLTLPDGYRTLDAVDARRRLETFLAGNADGRPPTVAAPSSAGRAIDAARQALRALPPTAPSGTPKPARTAYTTALTALGLLTDEDVAQLVGSGGAVPDTAWQLLGRLWDLVPLQVDPRQLLDDHEIRRAAFAASCTVRPVGDRDEVVFPDGASVRVAARAYAETIDRRHEQLGAREAARQVVAHAIARPSVPPSPAQDAAGQPTIVTTSTSCWTVTIEGAGAVDWDPLLHTGAAMPLPALLVVLDALADAGWRIQHVSEDRAVDHDANASFVTAARYLLARY